MSKRTLFISRYFLAGGSALLVAFDHEAITVQYISYQVKLLKIVREDTYVSVHETLEETVRTIHDEMVPVPGGMFRMGDLKGEGLDDKKRVRTVTVPAFRLGKYEVTFAQWDACVAGRGCDGYSPGDWG